MANQSFPKNITYSITIFFIAGIIPCLFASESTSYTVGNRGYIKSHHIPEVKKDTAFLVSKDKPDTIKAKQVLSALQKQARAYRLRGLDLQRKANLEGAIKAYQRAIELDPALVVVYNDLGIVYEANGSLKEAEESYLRAIDIDPDFLSAYSNLALLYENTRNYNKALFYWQKRAELGGLSDDPWTQKAKQRIEDIKIIQQTFPTKPTEREVLGLVRDTLKQKSIIRQDKRELAKTLLRRAKLSYEKNDLITALQKACDAQLLDPANADIQEFIDIVQKRLLSQ